MLRGTAQRFFPGITSPSGKALAERFLFLLLLSLLLFSALHFSTSDYPEFDGAMNFQVSKNLAEGKGYVTTYKDVKANIQTGPTLILPAALWFKFFGVSKFTTQLTNLIYLLGLILVVVGIAARYYSVPGWYALIALLAVPELFKFSLHGYGEAIAAFFTLAGFTFLVPALSGEKRQSAFCGISFGLAAVTKTLSLVSLGALAVFMVPYSLVVFKETPKRFLIRRWLIIATLFLILPLLFECVKVLQYGWQEYANQLATIVSSIGRQQGFGGLQESNAHPLLARLVSAMESMSEEFAVPQSWLYVYLGVLVVLVILFARRSLPAGPRFVLYSSVIYFLMGLVWWHFFTGQQWWRRIFQFYIVFVPAASFALFQWVRVVWLKLRSAKMRVEAESLGSLLVLGLLAYQILLGSTTNVQSANSRAVGDPDHVNAQIDSMLVNVAALPPRTALLVDLWWQAPIVSLFSNREDDIHDYRDDKVVLESFLHRKPVYFLLTYHEKTYDSIHYQSIYSTLKPAIRAQTSDYALCEISPGMYSQLVSGQISASRVCNFMAATLSDEENRSRIARWSPIIDFSKGDYQDQLCTGWYSLEQSDGIGYRWIWRTASCFLPSPQKYQRLTLSVYALLDRIPGDTQSVSVLMNDQMLLTHQIDKNRTTISLSAPLMSTDVDSAAVCTITVRVNTSIPPTSGDLRELGLIVSRIGFE